MPNKSFIKTPILTWECHKSKFQHKNCSTRKKKKKEKKRKKSQKHKK